MNKLSSSRTQQLSRLIPLIVGLSACSDASLHKEISDQAQQISKQDTQLANQEVRITEKQGQLETKQKQLINEKQEIRNLTSENRHLETEKSINRLFEDAQKVFAKNEAEVYRQNGTLTIRLRGLKFSTSQATLKAGNFQLLAKVQKVIKVFGKSTVVVEGYTDSYGNQDGNIKLSLSRAQVVRNYLLADNEIKSTSIKAVGYGYQQPLASNKSLRGRAQNRRVDILIKPERS